MAVSPIRPGESDPRPDYNPWRRESELWRPGQVNVVSRRQLEDYLNCPSCYWYYKRGPIRRQKSKGGPAMNLKAHKLFEKEFLHAAALNRTHHLFSSNGFYIGPFNHPKMPEWREPLRGGFRVQLSSDLIVTGAPDFIFQDLYDSSKLYLGDVKTMSRSSEERIEIHPYVPRQLEVYRWQGGRIPELAELGHSFSNTGFVIVANFPDHDGFLGDAWPVEKHLYPIELDDSWVEQAFLDLHETVLSDTPPPPCQDCPGCVTRMAYMAVDAARQNGMSPQQLLAQFREQMKFAAQQFRAQPNDDISQET